MPSWSDWLLIRHGAWLQLRNQSVRCTVDTLGWGALFLESEESKLCLLADGEELANKLAPLKFPDIDSSSLLAECEDGVLNNWRFSWSYNRLKLEHLDQLVSLQITAHSQQIALTHLALGTKNWPEVLAIKSQPANFTPVVPVVEPASLSKQIRVVTARGTAVLELPETVNDHEVSILKFLLAQGKTAMSHLKERFGRRVPGRLATLVLKFQEAGKENLQAIDQDFYLLQADHIL